MKRKPRVMWVSTSCLLDTSSGAAIAMLTLLNYLQSNGYDVSIIGMTFFDHFNGIKKIQDKWHQIQSCDKSIINIKSQDLTHQLAITKSTDYKGGSVKEFETWYSLYLVRLDEFKPDVVMFYGGRLNELVISAEARLRGIPTVYFLYNGSHTGKRWCKDVDLIVTDTNATADYYKEREGITAHAFGSLINPSNVVSQVHEKSHFTILNPVPLKGGIIFLQIAIYMLKVRPDIRFEVVEGRGSWQELVDAYFLSANLEPIELINIKVSKNTDDLRPIYSRARMIIAPSLWWESGGRVVAEAMLNGIPVLITNRGGPPEYAQDACIKLNMPDELYNPPFNKTLSDDAIHTLANHIIRVNDDFSYYDDLCKRAALVGTRLHNYEINAQKLIKLVQPLIDRCAGDMA